MKERTTPDSRNTPSTTNLEKEEIVDAPGNDGNASMPEQVKRPNPWRKMMMMITTTTSTYLLTAIELSVGGSSPYTGADKTNENKYT